ncbi:PPC domain-containing DNA-binding protein [Candidatus Cloacimonadota bacterium]
MFYKKGEDYYFLRFEIGEEIVTELQKFCEKEKVKLGFIQAIGAVNKAVVGFFHTGSKKYLSNELKGDHEITSLTGTITEMNDSPYLHLHISLADEENNVIGGHLNEAYVSVTCEMIITVLKGSVSRFKAEALGINLLDL